MLILKTHRGVKYALRMEEDKVIISRALTHSRYKVLKTITVLEITQEKMEKHATHYITYATL